MDGTRWRQQRDWHRYPLRSAWTIRRSCALRKQLSQIDLSEVNSALGSDAIAFALAVRGQLTGAFVCGPRLNGETFAPDEIAMLRNTVHEIGAELNAIRSREQAEDPDRADRGHDGPPHGAPPDGPKRGVRLAAERPLHG